jgi:hypothetical protein
VQVFALTSSQLISETLDLLREILEDEPEWVNVLRVVPIKLDGRNSSTN